MENQARPRSRKSSVHSEIRNAEHRVTKTKSIACCLCHARKIKCSGGHPCKSCEQAEKDCLYPARDRKVTLNQSYVEDLLREIQQLKENAPKRASEEAQAVPQDGPSSTGPKPKEGVQNPLFEDRPWFLPVPSLEMPIHIGEAADAAFSTRFRQTIEPDKASHIPRMNFITDETILALSEVPCPWPNAARLRYLVRVAMTTICRCFHIVRKSATLKLVEEVIASPQSIVRLQECKLFALFALGELYSTKTAVKDGSFPGLHYFAHARKLTTIPSERPSMETIEIALLLSVYSYSLNRRHSASLFASSAVRLAMIVGMHLKVPQAIVSQRAAREHRIRVWWTAYIFDRTWTAKLGHPVSIQNEDIHVEMPSNQDLGEEDKDDFQDQDYMAWHIKLSRVTGTATDLIYSRRTQQKPFSQRVQECLAKLTKWHDSLPPHLHLPKDEEIMPQHIVYLHLTFNQLVILVTRPVLLHLLRRQINPKQGDGEDSGTTTPVTGNARTIADTCVRCARHTYKLLNQAWILGAFAIFDYFYTRYLFSAATILSIASLMDTYKGSNDADDFMNAVALLRQLQEGGNFGAKEFCRHIDAIEQSIQKRTSRAAPENTSMGPVSTGPGRMPDADMTGPTSYNITQSMTTGMALADPSFQDFLAQSDPNVSLGMVPGLNEAHNPFWPDLWVENWTPI